MIFPSQADVVAATPTEVGALWSAGAATLTSIVAIVAVFVAVRQVAQARKLREDQAQPYIAVYLESAETRPQFVDLVIRNFGRTAATNVSVEITPTPQRSPDDRGPNPDDVLYPRTFRTLVPNQEWRTLWDFSPARNEMQLPSKHAVVVAYDGVPGTGRQHFEYELDWDFFIGRRWVNTYGVHDGAKALREIEKQVRRWSESLGGRGLRVYVRDGDERDERQREERRQMLSEHDDVTRILGLTPGQEEQQQQDEE